MKKMREKLICLGTAAAMLSVPCFAYADELNAQEIIDQAAVMEVSGEEENSVVLAGTEDVAITEIATVEDLQQFAQAVNAGTDYKGLTVTLNASLDLTGVEWAPIGTAAAPFRGTFDGQENTISNVDIHGTGDNTGFFGMINGATVKNVMLNTVTISGSKNNTGALVGQMSGSTITDCTVENVTFSTGRYNTSGILVGANFTGKIMNCSVSNSSLEGYQYVGGIAGSGYSLITGCTVDNVTVSASYWKCGGILGQWNEDSATMENNHVSNSNIIGTDNLGGIVGFANYGNKKLINCTVTNTVIGDSTQSTVEQSGGLIGSLSPSANNTISIKDCTVQNLSIVAKDSINEAAAVVGGVYWRSANTTNVDVSVENTEIADMKVEAEELTNVGVLFGQTQKASNYQMSDVTVSKSPEVIDIVGSVNEETKVNVASGTFDKDIGKYTEEGKTTQKDENGNYVVVEVDANMVLVQDETDGQQYNIVIKGTNGNKIVDFKAVEFSLNNTCTEGAVTYAVEAAEGLGFAEQNGKYIIYLDAQTAATGLVDNGEGIVVGSVRFDGYGKGSLVVEDGASAELEIENSIAQTVSLKKAFLEYDFQEVQGELKVTIAFNNPITAKNKPAYNKMKVVITGVDGYEEVHEIGDTYSWRPTYTADKAEITTSLPINTRYTVTVSGDGYRTAKKSILLHEEGAEVAFWNNVKDVAVDGETKNFLAGEIVNDGKINIYDLSAVVSYFGETGITVEEHPEYIKYDLNRDGKIDSKDVAMVLVSWNE